MILSKAMHLSKNFGIRLSRYFDIVRLSTVENISKIYRTFDGRNFRLRRHMSKIDRNFWKSTVSVKNRRYMSKIDGYFSTFSTYISKKGNIFKICLKSNKNGRKFDRKCQKLYRNFRDFRLLTHFRPFAFCQKYNGIFDYFLQKAV